MPERHHIDSGMLWLGNGQVMTGVHSRYMCEGRDFGCVIHEPLPHSLSDAPMHWIPSLVLPVRICEHKAAHPDWQAVAHEATLGVVWTHDCCEAKCCEPRPEWVR